MPSIKNYYQILNVKPTATDEEIKRSYRVLAKRYHPDVNPGDASASERFADINEAHDVLSDPKKRAEFDNKLKESAAPRLKPEDIIARQRAQAQAAARAAAMRNSMRENLRRDPNMTMAQRAQAMRAQAARAQAQAQAAQAAHAHAQAQAAQAQSQAQAQLNAIKTQAYQMGHERGFSEARKAAEKEISRLNTNLRTLMQENKRLGEQYAEVEKDRGELEQELFNRDRELTQEKSKVKELEIQLASLQQAVSTSKANSKRSAAEFAALTEKLNISQMQLKAIDQERKQAELKNKAQLELQQEKRRQMQERIEELSKKATSLAEENETLRSENNKWVKYAKSEVFLSDTERRLQDWEKKQKADKKQAKSTLYGLFGVLIWATALEIDAAYSKLVKRYSGKTDEATVEKLQKLKDAYKILADPEKRKAYNESIGITDAQIETERQLIIDYDNMKTEYRNQLESKEFWAHFDELTFSAQTGDAEAQNALGEMYYYGNELEQDQEQAVYWFKEAAKQKHAEAMYNLGVCFMNGEGVEKNKTTGMGFIRQAAKLGSESAKKYGIK